MNVLKYLPFLQELFSTNDGQISVILWIIYLICFLLFNYFVFRWYRLYGDRQAQRQELTAEEDRQILQILLERMRSFRMQDELMELLASVSGITGALDEDFFRYLQEEEILQHYGHEYPANLVQPAAAEEVHPDAFNNMIGLQTTERSME